MQWVSNPTKSPLSILLVHYNPLRNIRESLGFSDKKMRQFLEEKRGLPTEYQEQIISFKEELRMLDDKFDLDTHKMADDANVIICCWGEFMESPYQEKHVFQGKSRGAVFIYSYKDRTEVQGSFSWL